MKYNKLTIILLLLSLLSIGLVSASAVSITPVNETSDHIFPGEVAKYTISITNSDSTQNVYSWSTTPVEWIIESKTSVAVNAGETVDLDLFIKPNPNRFPAPGFYFVPLTVKTADGSEKIDKQFGLYIQNINELIYSDLIFASLSISVDEEVDPRKPMSVRANIRNRNILPIENLSLIISGDDFELKDTVSLGGLEETTLRYNVDLDPNVEPGTYKLFARISNDEKSISEVNELYDVIPYAVINRDSQEDTTFFKVTSISSLTNDGNVQKAITVDLDINWYDALFTDVLVEASDLEKVDRDSWTLILQPEETATVTVVKNYRVLVAILLLAVIAVIAYLLMRSPIVMQKQVIVTGKDDEGVSEMKIRIYLKNRTDKSFFNLRLLDKVPSIADVTPATGLGVLEPSKIVRTEKKGTIIKWDFDSLEAYEERILTYSVKARLKIIGNLGLPAVRVKFENVKGKQRTAESGKAVIGTKK